MLLLLGLTSDISDILTFIFFIQALMLPTFDNGFQFVFGNRGGWPDAFSGQGEEGRSHNLLDGAHIAGIFEISGCDIGVVIGQNDDDVGSI